MAFAWNSCGFATLMAMSSFQSLLRYIPEPSIILFLILAGDDWDASAHELDVARRDQMKRGERAGQADAAAFLRAQKSPGRGMPELKVSISAAPNML
ncbi:MAG: hypothetical protein WBL55_02925, partial [Xanthobacteraceae bacterium]